MLSLLALLGSVKNDASRVIFNTSVFRVYQYDDDDDDGDDDDQHHHDDHA